MAVVEVGETGAGAPRRLRADAVRNLEALLEAASTEFASAGVDVPMREIAGRAGVGIGTLYRHFPKRSDLIQAVFRRQVDACADAGPELAAQHEPVEALRRWLLRFTEFVATKRGLAAALHSGDPAYDALPAYFTARLAPTLGQLLTAAANNGQIVAAVDAEELLVAVSRLCMVGPDDDVAQTHRMVNLLVDGLRYGAERAQA